MPKKLTAPAADAYVTRARHTQFQTRAEGEELIIEGYFVVFNQPYYMDEWSEEVVCTGAFDGCDTSDVRALVDHLSHLVLGRSTAQTLTFQIDDTGLFATIRINAKDTDAMNLYARVQRGDVDQASFGFAWAEDGVVWESLPDGRARRSILRIEKLWEISVCTFPAYEQTFVAARDRVAAEAKAEARRARKNLLKRRFKHHAETAHAAEETHRS